MGVILLTKCFYIPEILEKNEASDVSRMDTSIHVVLVFVHFLVSNLKEYLR